MSITLPSDPVGAPERVAGRRRARRAARIGEVLRVAALIACASVVRRLLDHDAGHADANRDTRARRTRPWETGGAASGRHPGSARNEVMVMAAMCNGCLVLHRDGEIAYCSEELDGKSCLGYDAPHLAGVMACRVTPRGTRCRHCDEVMRRRLLLAPDFIPDGLWAVAN
jgi:hypothetical protein